MIDTKGQLEHHMMKLRMKNRDPPSNTLLAFEDISDEDEKPVKAKAAKAAPAPAPEPEQPEAPAITETRLRETVKTLPNEGKAKLKAYFVKKYGYNTMAEIAPEHYADIHAAAIKIGAVDTDPDAAAEEVDLG